MLVAAAATLVMPAMLRGLIDQRLQRRPDPEISRILSVVPGGSRCDGRARPLRAIYFVTWLGERVIADIRKAVFDHVLGLTPAFFEMTRTGEVLSRLTADTTLIQTVVGSSASVAMRNLLMFVGGLIADVRHQREADAARRGGRAAVVVPLIAFGRWVRTLSRKSQDRIADTSAHASETLNAVHDRSGLHA